MVHRIKHRVASADTLDFWADRLGSEGVGTERVDGALRFVWDAIARAGADDHFVFAEHPDLPQHWRRPEGGGPPPGALG